MKDFGELNIDFYSKADVAVRIWSQLPDRPELGDICFFISYVLGQLVRLKGTNLDIAIANALIKEGSTFRTGNFSFRHHINAADIEIPDVRLVQYHGKGDKGFDAVLNFLNTQPALPSLKVNPHGFGIFGREVNFYVLQSIAALINYLDGQYKDKSQMSSAFDRTLPAIGFSYMSGRIGVGNSQGEAAMRVLSQAFQKQSPG